MNHRASLAGCLALPFALALAASSHAQVYPERPITMIIPLAPGGSAGNVGRVVAGRMEPGLGQQVVVDYKPGAATMIGTRVVAKAKPDGYTIGVIPVSAIATSLPWRKLPYDPFTELTPISSLTKGGFVLVASAKSGYRAVSDVITAAKANPGRITLASTGIGSTHHLAGELLQLMAGIKLLHVPYKGTGPANVAVVSGEVQLSISGAPGVTPHVREGTLRMLGVTGPQRFKNLPDVPTIAETLPGYSSGEAGLSLFGTGGTPAAIVKRLNAEVKVALAHPETIKFIEVAGNEPNYSSPEELGALLQQEVKRWSDLKKATGLEIRGGEKK